MANVSHTDSSTDARAFRTPVRTESDAGVDAGLPVLGVLSGRKGPGGVRSGGTGVR